MPTTAWHKAPRRTYSNIKFATTMNAGYSPNTAATYAYAPPDIGMDDANSACVVSRGALDGAGVKYPEASQSTQIAAQASSANQQNCRQRGATAGNSHRKVAGRR